MKSKTSPKETNETGQKKAGYQTQIKKKESKGYWMGPLEAAEKWGCHRNLVYKWIRQGRLHYKYENGRYKIPRASERPKPMVRGQLAWHSHKGAEELKKRKDKERTKKKISQARSGIAAIIKRHL